MLDVPKERQKGDDGFIRGVSWDNTPVKMT